MIFNLLFLTTVAVLLVALVIAGVKGCSGVDALIIVLRWLLSPVLFVVFFISKNAFTRMMIELEWPRRDIVLEGKLYLRRFYLTPPGWKYKVFLHHIAESDSGRDFHDHPFGFLSIILSGGYYEHVVFPRTPKGYTRTRRFGAVNIVSATHTHRVALIPGAAQTWTFLIAGPTRRKWGFWILGEDLGCRNDRWVEAVKHTGNKKDSGHYPEDKIRP